MEQAENHKRGPRRSRAGNKWEMPE
jgi:hypothetical protein